MTDRKTKQLMDDLAKGLDHVLNGSLRGKERKTAFVLLIMPFDGPKGARTNYVSNADRASIVEMMKEVIARFDKTGEIDDG